MKAIRLTFLFFLNLILFSCQNRNDTLGDFSLNRSEKDSIKYYYYISKNESLVQKERIKAINKSFKKSLNQKYDSFILKSLSYKSYLHGDFNQNDSAIYYSQELLKYGVNFNDTKYIAKANFKLGFYHRKIGNPISSLHFYNESIKNYKSLNDSNNIGRKLLNLSNLLNSFGDFKNSEIIAIEGLNYIKDEDKYISGLYNALAISTVRQKSYNDALYWYDQALTVNNEDSIPIITILNNKALVFIQQNKYNKAIRSLSNLLKSSKLTEDQKLKVRIKSSLAYAKSKLNHHEAEKEMLNVLNAREEINDLSGQYASNIHLVEYYQSINQDKKALFHAHQAYRLADIIKSKTSKIEALSYLIDLMENPTKEAREYKTLTDSLYTARERAKNQFAKIKYNTEENRRRILILNKEKAEQQVAIQKQKTTNIIYLSLGILTVFSSIFLFFYLKIKHRKEKILERHTTEKRLSKKLHDEVGNDVFYLMSQLQQETHPSTNSANNRIIHGLDAVYHKVRDFSRDHKIETGPEYGDELLSLLNSYGNQHIRVFTNTQKDNFWETVADYKKVELYWVLKELLTNMKKHSQATIVSVGITKEKKNIIVKYTDNGIGMNLNTAHKHKNGLYNVENRIKDMKGTITFETKPQEGFKASIKFAP